MNESAAIKKRFVKSSTDKSTCRTSKSTAKNSYFFNSLPFWLALQQQHERHELLMQFFLLIFIFIHPVMIHSLSFCEPSFKAHAKCARRKKSLFSSLNCNYLSCCCVHEVRSFWINMHHVARFLVSEDLNKQLLHLTGGKLH
jgi:hypothetical protein